MSEILPERIFRNVPLKQREIFSEFRLGHPYKKWHDWEYIASGSGAKTLLLLHGGFVNAEMFFHQIRALEKEYRIIAPNVPSTLSTMEEVCLGLVEILKTEGIDKTIFLGYCFGGMVAQCFVRSHPELVEHLILSNTLHPSKSSTYAKKGIGSYRNLRFIPISVLRKLFRLEVAKDLAHDFTEPSGWSEWPKAYINEVLSKITRQSALSQMDIMADYMVNYEFTPEDLQHWQGRIIILSTEDDELEQRQLEGLKNIYPSARIHTFQAGLGAHAILWFSPEKYVTEIKEFLASSSQAH